MRRDLNTWARGEQGRRAKLTESQVLEILDAAERRNDLRKQLGQLTNEALAERYGVSAASIVNVVHGKTWRHV